MIYCLCLLEREVQLNKTWLANHRKSYSKNLPACKSKNQSFSKTLFISIQKEQIERNTNTKRTKNTDEGPYSLSESFQREYMGPHRKKRIRTFLSKTKVRKASRAHFARSEESEELKIEFPRYTGSKYPQFVCGRPSKSKSITYPSWWIF